MDRSFTPDSANSQEFRTALGSFATGVAIVTCIGRSGPAGITVNSFASVSLDPPLVLWSPARASGRHEDFVAADRFSIHILSSEQRDLCAAFARRRDPFDEIDWLAHPEHDVPLIQGCLSRFDCAREAVHDGGDHSIIVGRVLNVTHRQGESLVFSAGRYGEFHPHHAG